MAFENMTIEERKTMVTNLLLSVERPGIDKLIKFLDGSDFYAAPASTKFHSCHKGGLAEHSLNVYSCLEHERYLPCFKPLLSKTGNDSFIIAGLLHDVCKIALYKPAYKNKKVYSESGSKSDEGGKYDWVSEESYIAENKIPYGHGEKSVMMIREFIKLKPEEMFAIRWHMGYSEPKELFKDVSGTFRHYPLALALYQADLSATFTMEKEE